MIVETVVEGHSPVVEGSSRTSRKSHYFVKGGVLGSWEEDFVQGGALGSDGVDD